MGMIMSAISALEWDFEDSATGLYAMLKCESNAIVQNRGLVFAMLSKNSAGLESHADVSPAVWSSGQVLEIIFEKFGSDDLQVCGFRSGTLTPNRRYRGLG